MALVYGKQAPNRTLCDAIWDVNNLPTLNGNCFPAAPVRSLPALASHVALWASIWTLNRGPALNSVRQCGDEPGTSAIIVSGGIVNSADGKERDPAVAMVCDCNRSYEYLYQVPWR